MNKLVLAILITLNFAIPQPALAYVKTATWALAAIHFVPNTILVNVVNNAAFVHSRMGRRVIRSMENAFVRPDILANNANKNVRQAFTDLIVPHAVIVKITLIVISVTAHAIALLAGVVQAVHFHAGDKLPVNIAIDANAEMVQVVICLPANVNVGPDGPGKNVINLVHLAHMELIVSSNVTAKMKQHVIGLTVNVNVHLVGKAKIATVVVSRPNGVDNAKTIVIAPVMAHVNNTQVVASALMDVLENVAKKFVPLVGMVRVALKSVKATVQKEKAVIR